MAGSGCPRLDDTTFKAFAVSHHMTVATVVLCGEQVVIAIVDNRTGLHTAGGIQIIPVSIQIDPAGLHVAVLVHAVPVPVVGDPGRLCIAAVRIPIPPAAVIPLPACICRKNRHCHHHRAANCCRYCHKSLLHTVSPFKPKCYDLCPAAKNFSFLIKQAARNKCNITQKKKTYTYNYLQK